MIDYKNILQEKKKLILSNYTVPQTITQEWISQMFLDNKSTFFIWGWCYRDISSAIFSQEVTADTLNKISFDDKTEFPVKLPVGYEPEKLLKETRKVPLGIELLHAKGVSGQGMSVAIIDSAFLPHVETERAGFYYYEHSKIASEHFHGLLTSTILAGKKLGIVPNAKCYFYTMSQMTAERDGELVDGLKKIYEQVSKGEKICVVSLSMPYPKSTKDEYYEVVEKLKEADCQVIDSVEFNKDFICGRFTSADVLNLEYVDLNDWQKEGEWQQTIESRIVIPSAGRALPLWGTEDRYHYCAQSGVSWSIPMLAGLYCLAKQMNPDVEYQEFVRLIKETAYKNKSGLNVINISLLSARLK